jgi:branched-chain amino acid transport system permease protein
MNPTSSTSPVVPAAAGPAGRAAPVSAAEADRASAVAEGGAEAARAAAATPPISETAGRRHGVGTGIALLAALLAVAPFVGLYPEFMMKALCFALFACAFNLLIGYVGLLSFGHAMFFGMASYVSAYAAKRWGFSPELAILAGTGSAALMGIVAGVLAIRRQGIYFAMITLALAQMVFFFCLQAAFTGGEDGIQAVPRGKLLGVLDLSNSMVLYYFVLAVFIGGFALIYRIVNSPFGQVLKAIRENEPRAVSLGYDADRYKLAAFVLSATLAGLAGATKALVVQLASLTDVHWTMSGEVVLMTLLGGMGTIFGPVVGAFAIMALENYLASFGQWVTVITGTIFVVCVLAFRRGIVGEVLAFWERRRKPREG